jgi:hypothetical protein
MDLNTLADLQFGRRKRRIHWDEMPDVAPAASEADASALAELDGELSAYMGMPTESW